MTKPQNPWPAINVGSLRHQVQIKSQSSTQDSVGQPVLTWNLVRATSAGLNLVSMKEAFGEGQLTAQETDIWTLRWTSTEILPGMQLVFGANTYIVQMVSNVMRRNLIVHLLCLQLNAKS